MKIDGATMAAHLKVRGNAHGSARVHKKRELSVYFTGVSHNNYFIIQKWRFEFIVKCFIYAVARRLHVQTYIRPGRTCRILIGPPPSN